MQCRKEQVSGDMLDYWDWLDGKRRVWLVVLALVFALVCGTMGYLTRATLHSALQGPATPTVAVTPTPTVPQDMVLVWAGSSDTQPLSSLSPPLWLTARQASQGIALYWRCLPSPDGLPTAFSVNIEQDGNAFAWVGNVVHCGGSGANYITGLHGGVPFHLRITATGPWTVRVLAHTP